MNQAQVISKIDTEVFQNNYNAITGTILNGVLKAMYQNIYSAEVGVGLLPTVASDTILPTDDLSTILARIIYGANASNTLAGVLANDNKTGGQDLTSDDLTSIASIINGYVWLRSGTPASTVTGSFTTSGATNSGLPFAGFQYFVSGDQTYYIRVGDTITISGQSGVGNNNGTHVLDNVAFYGGNTYFTSPTINAFWGNIFNTTIATSYTIPANLGQVYLSTNEAGIFNQYGGFVSKEGSIGIIPNYFQVKSTESVIKHASKVVVNTTQTDINSLLTVMSPSGKSAHYVNDIQNRSYLYDTGFYGEIGIDSNNTFMYYDDGGSTYGYVRIKVTGNEFIHTVRNAFTAPSNEFLTGGAYFTTGLGIDTLVSGGTDVLNIGATNANVINYGNASTIHNFLGTAIYELQVNSYVEDKLITLNYGGSIASGIGVGFEIEENSVITGYFKTNAARNGFRFLLPATTFIGDLNFDLLTADRAYSLPNGSGTLALESFVDSKVTDSITDGVLTVAPSQNAVYDALLMKADKQNGLVSGGAISVGTYGGTGTDNDIRVAAATWYISPSNYTTAGNTDFLDITLAAAGLQRYVGFYGDNTNTITMVDGAESEYAVYPATPVGKALIGYVLVTDSAAASTPDLSGYLLIASKATASDIITGTDNTKYVTSSVMQGIVAKYQNLATATATTLSTNVANYRDTFSSVTALASAMSVAAPTGTPTNGTKLWYRFKDNGTARALTWNAAFVNRGGTLPTTTVLGKIHNIGLVYNSVTSTWDCVAATVEA